MTDKTLKQLQEEAHRIAVEHGWWEPHETSIISWDSGVDDGDKALVQRTFGDQIALMHSELSEALEAFRERGLEKWDEWPEDDRLHKWDGGSADSANEYLEQHAKKANELGIKAKPEGAFVELADCIIRILDTAGHHGVDMQALMEEKMAFNETRPFRHGGKAL